MPNETARMLLDTPVSEHTFRSPEGGHDLGVKTYHDGHMILRQGDDMIVLSPADFNNLNNLRQTMRRNAR